MFTLKADRGTQLAAVNVEDFVKGMSVIQAVQGIY